MRDRLLVDDPSLASVVYGLQAAADRRATPDGCLDDLAIAEVLDGRARPAQAPGYQAHLASCGHCRAQLASLAELLAEEPVRREVRRLAPARRVPFALAGLLAVAATVVLVFGWPRFAVEPSPHRAPTITATAAPVPISPIGAVASVVSLRWASVAGADRYRVTLFDARGTAVFETQTADTLVALPATLALARGLSYLWQVEARTAPDRWSPSAMVQFTLGRTP